MESILLKRDGAIATVTLNRPAALNALSPQMNLELSEVTSELELDESVRCVVIQGAGDHFMAGGDVKGFSEAMRHPFDWIAAEEPTLRKDSATLPTDSYLESQFSPTQRPLMATCISAHRRHPRVI